MPKLTDKHGKPIAFTMVRNEIIDSDKIDIFAKMTYVALARHGPLIFPSYGRIMKLAGFKKRNIVTRSLKVLEQHKVIVRFKSGQKIYYWLIGTSIPRLPDDAVEVAFGNSAGSSRELTPVTHGNPNKNEEQENLIRGEVYSVDEIQRQLQQHGPKALVGSLLRKGLGDVPSKEED